MDNVNNLNGVPNFGHGEEVIPTIAEEPSVDEVETETEDSVKVKKVRKSK